MIAIGAVVLFNMTGAIEPMAENSPAASTVDNVVSDVEDSAGTAFTLTTLVVIVIICSVILAVCMRGLGRAFAT